MSSSILLTASKTENWRLMRLAELYLRFCDAADNPEVAAGALLRLHDHKGDIYAIWKSPSLIKSYGELLCSLRPAEDQAARVLNHTATDGIVGRLDAWTAS